MPKRPEPASPSDAYLLGRWFAAVRREGLLALLPADAWHTLSAILSFTGRDSRRSFTVDQLATALGISRDGAQARLHQLADETAWRGEPLITLEKDPEGAVVGAAVAAIEVLARVQPEASESTDGPERIPSGTDAEMIDLRRALAEVGLEPAQVEHLVRAFPAERIQRQLVWLPARQARKPAAFLIRAIEQDWEAPREGK